MMSNRLRTRSCKVKTGTIIPLKPTNEFVSNESCQAVSEVAQTNIRDAIAAFKIQLYATSRTTAFSRRRAKKLSKSILGFRASIPFARNQKSFLHKHTRELPSSKQTRASDKLSNYLAWLEIKTSSYLDLQKRAMILGHR